MTPGLPRVATVCWDGLDVRTGARLRGRHEGLLGKHSSHLGGKLRRVGMIGTWCGPPYLYRATTWFADTALELSVVDRIVSRIP